jgi:hypothetical protein
MALIDIGGRMPDGVKVHEFWVDESSFVCASGTALEMEGSPKKIMGKLCLLSNALIMLPYEGAWLKIGEFLIGRLQGLILGEYADMATCMDRLGLIDLKANYRKLDKILIWPLSMIEKNCRVEVHSFLCIKRGASLHIRINNRKCAFQLSNRGYEIGSFASAQDFCEAILQLL